MVTVQEIFDAAIDLMDEQDENTGSTKTTDTREYELRTISILNIGIQQLYQYSSDYDRTEKRPFVRLLADDRNKPDFEQYIPLDDSLCWGLLPYYLASLLRSGEDTEFSMRMMTEYNNAFNKIAPKVLAEFERIETPYSF